VNFHRQFSSFNSGHEAGVFYTKRLMQRDALNNLWQKLKVS
jgi:hypothetical protein